MLDALPEIVRAHPTVQREGHRRQQDGQPQRNIQHLLKNFCHLAIVAVSGRTPQKTPPDQGAISSNPSRINKDNARKHDYAPGVCFLSPHIALHAPG